MTRREAGPLEREVHQAMRDGKIDGETALRLIITTRMQIRAK